MSTQLCRGLWSDNGSIMDINFSELKAHLSRCLRKASRGARIIVRDRYDAIAEIGPPAVPVDIQASLRAVREDPNEVRGR